MTKYCALVVFLVLSLSIGSAGAADKTFIATPVGISDASYKSEFFVVKDMSLTAWDKGEGLTEVVFSYQVTRLSQTFKRFNVMLTGLSQAGAPLWAMSVKPDLRNLAANRPWKTKTTVFVPEGAFRNAAKVWMRIVNN